MSSAQLESSLPLPLPRPVPSLATLPSSSSKKARRARRAASRDSQRAAAAGTASGTDTTSAAHLRNIRDKEKARSSSLKKGQHAAQPQPQQPPQQSHSPHSSDASGSVSGISRSLTDWMLAKIQSVQSWQSKGDQRPTQPSSRASVTAAAPSFTQDPAASSSRSVAGFGFGWSGDSASSDPAATSGNETDWEHAAMAAQGIERQQQTQRQQQPAGSQVSSATASRSNSDMDAPHSPLRRMASPQAAVPLVACHYAEFGCEARVREGGPNSSSPDPHYATAAAHHVSLLHATCTILSSQKQQQAQRMLEHSAHMVAHDERMQRRLQRKADVIAQLRQRVDQKQAALQHANVLRMRNVQDLVSSFVGEAPFDARKLLRAQHDEIAELRAQLAMKDSLLREIAEHLKKMPQQQQQQQSTTTQAPTQEHDKPIPRAQKKKQRAAAAPVAPVQDEQPKQNDATTVSPPPAAAPGSAAAAPSAAIAGAAVDAALPLGAATRSPIVGSVKSPLSPAPFRLSASTFKVPAQRVPKVSTLQQQHEQREAAAAQLAREQAEASQAAASSQSSTAYYKLPHSSLKALGPLVSSAQMLNLVSSFATGQAPTIVYVQHTNQNTAANHRQERAGTGPATTGAEGQPNGATRMGALSSRGGGGGGTQTDDDSDREETSAPFTFNSSDEPGAIRSAPVGAAKLCPQMWRQTKWMPINQKPRQEGME